MAENTREVVVTDIKIHFWSMVVLLVKWAIAAIPAVVIVLGLLWAVSAAVSLVFGDWYQLFFGGASWL